MPDTPPADKPGSRRERLIVLTLFGLLALNYPLLQLFDTAATWFGIPVILLYLLGVWGVFIIAAAWILEPGSSRTTEGPPEQQG
jgi:hypothetical protein